MFIGDMEVIGIEIKEGVSKKTDKPYKLNIIKLFDGETKDKFEIMTSETVVKSVGEKRGKATVMLQCKMQGYSTRFSVVAVAFDE